MWSYTYPSRTHSEYVPQSARVTSVLVGMVNVAERFPLVSYMPFAGTVTEWAKNASVSYDDSNLAIGIVDQHPGLPMPTASNSTPQRAKPTLFSSRRRVVVEDDNTSTSTSTTTTNPHDNDRDCDVST